MLSNTSTEWAPWHVIPADRKWFARLAGGAVILQALMQIDPRFPVVDKQQREALAEAKAALVAQAPKGAAPDPFEQARQNGAATKVSSDGADPVAAGAPEEPDEEPEGALTREEPEGA
jgi:hypothetical protein